MPLHWDLPPPQSFGDLWKTLVIAQEVSAERLPFPHLDVTSAPTSIWVGLGPGKGGYVGGSQRVEKGKGREVDMDLEGAKEIVG